MSFDDIGAINCVKAMDAMESPGKQCSLCLSLAMVSALTVFLLFANIYHKPEVHHFFCSLNALVS